MIVITEFMNISFVNAASWYKVYMFIHIEYSEILRRSLWRDCDMFKWFLFWDFAYKL